MTFLFPRFLAALASVSCALAIATAPAQAQSTTQTVTDLAGRSVTVPAKVERILLGEGRLLPALGVFERQDVARRLVGMMGDYETLDAAGYAQWRSRFPHLDKVPRVGRNHRDRKSVV